jgi:hypothetical protein
MAAGLLHVAFSAKAQEGKDSGPANKCNLFYSQEYLINQWTLDVNPGKLFFYNELSKISRAKTFYGITENNIRRAMDPGRTNALHITTESLQAIGKVRVRGIFGYQSQHYNDMLYNGNLDFRNMNLYMLGDTVGGKQRQEGYYFTAEAAYPLLNDRLILGMRMDYESAIGAKMKDLRNKSDISRTTFTPGIVYRMDHFSLGVSGGYITETNFVNVTAQLDDRHTLFYHMGMGHYSASGNFSTSESVRYQSEGIHAGLQLEYSGSGFSSFHKINYYDLETTALVGSLYRLVNGITDYNKITYTGTLLLPKTDHIHYVRLDANLATMNGTEVRQESQSVRRNGQFRTEIRTLRWIDDKHIVNDNSGGVEYQFIKRGQKRPYHYMITAGADVSMYEATHYPVQNYGYYDASSVTAKASYRHFIKGRRINIDPSIGVEYRSVLDSEAVFRPFPNYLSQIPELDFRYFSEDYYMGKLGVSISSSRLPVQGISQAFLEINSTYAVFPNIDLDSNQNTSLFFTLGIVF